MRENPAEQPDNRTPVEKAFSYLGHCANQDVVSISRMSGKWNTEGIKNAINKANELLELIQDAESQDNIEKLLQIFSEIDTESSVTEEDLIFGKITDLLESIENRIHPPS